MWSIREILGQADAHRIFTGPGRSPTSSDIQPDSAFEPVSDRQGRRREAADIADALRPNSGVVQDSKDNLLDVQRPIGRRPKYSTNRSQSASSRMRLAWRAASGEPRCRRHRGQWGTGSEVRLAFSVLIINMNELIANIHNNIQVILQLNDYVQAGGRRRSNGAFPEAMERSGYSYI